MVGGLGDVCVGEQVDGATQYTEVCKTRVKTHNRSKII